MKTIKIFLLVMSVLLIVALGFGIYVWSKFQSLEGYEIQSQDNYEVGQTVSENVFNNTGESQTSSTKKDVSVVETASPESENFEISTADLPIEQQEIIKKYFGTDTLVITSEMVVCITDEIGTERVSAISDGENPDLTEILYIISCM